MVKERVSKLISDGWVQQFTSSGARLREAVENYEMLGFEVLTIPVKELEMDGCTDCFDDPNDRTYMIFTRK